jgi:hypothetical protein
MKKLLTLSLVGSFVILTATAQDQIKSYTVEKYDGAQYVKQDSVDYLWTTNQDDEKLFNNFILQGNRLVPLYEGFYYNNYQRRDFFKWDDLNNSFESSIRNIQALNQLGQIESRISQGIDSGGLVNQSKWEYFYDGSGSVNEEFYYIWRDTAWEVITKVVRTFVNNQLDTVNTFYFGNTAWVPNAVISFKYSNSKISEKLSKNLIGANSQELNYHKTIYTYDNLTNSNAELVQTWRNNNWMDGERLTTYYNSNNQVDSTVFESPAGLISKRKTFTYNSHGINDIISSNYNRSQLKYYPQIRETFNYDNNGVLVSIVEESIDPSGWLVKSNDLKYNYNFQTRVGLAEQSSLVNLKVYPNPTSDQITISTKVNRINQIRIVDLAGRVVFENQSALNSNEVTIPVRQLNNGTYILTVTSNGQQKSQKIVVNH